jgi:hypothetical protein
MTSNGAHRAEGISAARDTDARVDGDDASNAPKADARSGQPAVSEASPAEAPSHAEASHDPPPTSGIVTAPAEATEIASEAVATEIASEAVATEIAAPPENVTPAEATPARAASAVESAPAQSSSPGATSSVPAPVSVPPTRLENVASPPFSSLAPAIVIDDEMSPRSTFWHARPNRTWMLVGGSAIVIAFLSGVLIGRFIQPERSPEFVSQASLPAPQTTVVAPTGSESPAPPTEDVPPSAATQRAPAKRAATGFNAKAAKAAIDAAAPRLKACRHAGEPIGPASVIVTFEPSGGVSSASVTTKGYAGTRTGTCIVQRLRDVRIPAFTGAAVTVKRSVAVR